MAQHLVEKVDKHDYGRSARMAFYGGCIFGPAATTWCVPSTSTLAIPCTDIACRFGFLQSRVRFPGSPNVEILARVGLDQFAFAPCNMALFLSTMAVMEGSSPKEKLASTYWPALSTNWLVWPFVQMANFKFVPLDGRVLVVNIVSLGWNCYLSFLNSQGKTQDSLKKLEVSGLPE